MARFRKGRIQRLKPLAGNNVDRGVIMDIKDGWRYPFEAERGMFKINEIVEYMPSPKKAGEKERLSELDLVIIRKSSPI